MDEATCTKQCCVRAEVVIVAWAMMGKFPLVALRDLGFGIAGFGRIFVSGECELEYVVSDLRWDLEERRGRLGIWGDCWLWSIACYIFARSRRSTRSFQWIGTGTRLHPVRCGCFCPGHFSMCALTMLEQMLGGRWTLLGYGIY